MAARRSNNGQQFIDILYANMEKKWKEVLKIRVKCGKIKEERK